ncbi:MAG TPA: hypothetical protein VMY06_14945 [Sedimentisphaerales bacterium]|nr:hypothetical protein [Sedimentisphaerales bacterium]HUU15562.1 hypothetical protein [Sedimentisphaerales bacterium]
MKKFKFTADIEFEAENIDVAFDLLEKHFLNLVHDLDDEESGNWDDNWFVGEMNIEPKE